MRGRICGAISTMVSFAPCERMVQDGKGDKARSHHDHRAARPDLPNDALRLLQRPEAVDTLAVGPRHRGAHGRRASGDEQVVVLDDRAIVQGQGIGLRVELGGAPAQIRLTFSCGDATDWVYTRAIQ